MKILFIGDIFGEPGRLALQRNLPSLVGEYGIDFVIVNCENAAHGRGVTAKIAEELLASKVNVLTSGNHIWDQKEMAQWIVGSKRLLRPANYPPTAPGCGFAIYNDYLGIRVGVINLEGTVHLPSKDCPFRTADAILDSWKGLVDLVLVDFHAEATSEKRALGWYLDGRVAAVLGTHTHVPTADAEVLPKGTAYQTDVGMTGPYDSVIGLEKTAAFKRFITKMPLGFVVAEKDVRIGGAVITVDERTGKATAIESIFKKVN